jgi:hypothetical protein
MPAGSTYSTIATTTLGSAANAYTFTSIPTTYTDLVIVLNGQFTSGGNQYTQIQVGNGSVDTGTNYSNTVLAGTGTSAVSGRDTGNNFAYATTLASTSGSTGVGLFNFMNYSNTSTFKTILSRGSDANGWAIASAGLWRSTSAINTIKIFVGSGTFVAGSTFTLYGITAA